MDKHNDIKTYFFFIDNTYVVVGPTQVSQTCFWYIGFWEQHVNSKVLFSFAVHSFFFHFCAIL